MRIAVVVGVVDYEFLPPLEAVANDVTAVERLLRATGRYDEVLNLSGKLKAEDTKKSIMAFLESYGGQQLDEVFFYYSGHGDQVDEVLSFPMADWRERERRQQAIKNDELDRWLRELGPALTVKVLDCCYAGVPYVKSAGDLRKALEASKVGFRDCYFFSSSRCDQVSRTRPGPGALSVFTEGFVRAVVERPDGEVRYQQLVDAIADCLDGEEQEPQFITQGSAKHVFCVVDARLRSAVELGELEEESAGPPVEAMTTPAILEAVRVDAERYIQQEEAVATLAGVRARVDGMELPVSGLEPFYDLSVRFAGSKDFDVEVAGERVIGKWLKTRGRDFFGWPTEAEPIRNPTLAAVEWWRSREPLVTGFATSSGLEYDRILAQASPKFPNLQRWEFAVVFLWAPRELAVFSSSVSPRRIRWDRYDEPEEVSWRRRHFMRDQLSQVERHVEDLARDFWSKVESGLADVFGGK